MTEHPATTPSATSGTRGFDERLSVPWWWYLLTAGIGALLGAEVHMGYPGLRAWIGYAVLIPVLLAATAWLGRTRIRVHEGTLRAGDRSVSLQHVGRTEIVARQDRQAAMGPELDPLAHVVHRPWIRRMARIEITDPDAETPYWIVSVRNPEALVRALAR